MRDARSTDLSFADKICEVSQSRFSVDSVYLCLPVETPPIFPKTFVAPLSLTWAVVTLERVILYAVIMSTAFDERQVGEIVVELVDQNVLRGDVNSLWLDRTPRLEETCRTPLGSRAGSIGNPS